MVTAGLRCAPEMSPQGLRGVQGLGGALWGFTIFGVPYWGPKYKGILLFGGLYSGALLSLIPL